jgi:formylmethanofuran dehydrogenase subunit E
MGEIINYDKWKLDSGQEVAPVAKCEECSAELYENDEVINVDGDYVCDECFDSYAFEALGAFYDLVKK